LLSDPDPLRLPIDEEKNDSCLLQFICIVKFDSWCNCIFYCRSCFGGCIQQDAVSSFDSIMIASIIPIELTLKMEKTALVGLELIEEGHANAPFIQLSHSSSQPM